MLPLLLSVHQLIDQKALRESTGRLEEQNKLLQDRYGSVQQEASQLTRERNAIQAEVDGLKRRLEEAEGRAGLAESKNESDVREEIRRLERALENAIEESTRRVAETSQVLITRGIIDALVHLCL